MAHLLYHCHQCKKVKKDIDDLLFVEESFPRGFCSEPCIESYFASLVDHYESLEKKWRKELDLKEEVLLEMVGQPQLMEKVINFPYEIWSQTNQLGESLHCFLAKELLNVDGEEQQVHVVLLCLTYYEKPSFIFATTLTTSDDLVEKYRTGEKKSLIKSSTDQDESIPSDEEIKEAQVSLDHIERKKSLFLAGHLERRNDSDIRIEEYALYESHYQSTLDEPDEIFQFEDSEGDHVFSFIKAHERSGTSFYYIILQINLSDAVKGADRLVPIISFPTVDGELSDYYRQGQLISGNLKN